MPTRQADPVPVPIPAPVPLPPAPPAPPAKSLWANVIGGVGVFMMLLGTGIQSASPETVAAMGDALPWGELAGALLAAGGFIKHTFDKKDNEKDAKKAIDTLHASAETAVDATHAAGAAAIQAADLAPPSDPETKRKGSTVTVASAIGQAMMEEPPNTKLAMALVKAVEENPAS